jgi:hypothetical protein
MWWFITILLLFSNLGSCEEQKCSEESLAIEWEHTFRGEQAICEPPESQGCEGDWNRPTKVRCEFSGSETTKQRMRFVHAEKVATNFWQCSSDVGWITHYRMSCQINQTACNTIIWRDCVAFYDPDASATYIAALLIPCFGFALCMICIFVIGWGIKNWWENQQRKDSRFTA